MQPLNYSTQAIPDLKKYSLFLKSEGNFNGFVFVESLIEKLTASVKFIMPENGEIFETRDVFTSVDVDGFNLPYENISLEFRINFDRNVEKELKLIPDRLNLLTIPKYIILAYRSINKLGTGKVIWPIAYVEESGGFIPGISGRFVRDNANVVNGRIQSEMVYIPGLESKEEKRHEEVEKTVRRHIRQHDSLFQTVIDLCKVLECNNVATSEIVPRESVNKQRAKEGKPPFFTYKILELTPFNENNRSSSPGGGSHSSPRVHLRRGHIRRLPPDHTRKIWVNSCVVGNKAKGMVHKDYAVKAKGGN